MVDEPLNDARGVDRAAIRELLRLSPADRVERLIEQVRVWSEIRNAADTTRS